MIRLAATMRCPTVMPVGSNFLVEAIEPRDTLTGAAITATASDGTPLRTIWRPERVADYAETIRA
ncbi:MAG: hypothetical protein ACOX1P_22640 [Thermoguttaceae bacterium]